ncbi:hypothetical protein CsSME_00052286 [Camellia sinensis var. sinensis]|uniref:serine/arginine repetitive matrix protein 1 n=1 Tax=Camellia sinensis TaxID=4442 RepID=UPI001035B3F3|nr:serine/arginine repetitive matrix protein 1 [Camellia sinensis]
MFEGLLKSKFYSKCKSAIKLTKTRIDMIKRKRNAMEKFLRKDIADLLKTGLDINAYGRSEGFLVELNMSACYDFIEQFCGCILNHLSLMNKQRECPEECKEAVPSLMFAAARFADLPELRDLRSIFSERYGNSIEAYVDQKFVEKLKPMPPTKDMKLQLLQDIALESGLEWDSKALEQKLYNPPPSEQDLSENANDDKNKLHRSKDEPVRKTGNPAKQHHASDAPPKRNKEDDDRYKPRGSENREKTPSIDIRVARTDQNDPQTNSNSERKVSEENADDKKQQPSHHRFIPPPYTKPKASETEINGRDTVADAKPKPRSVRRTRVKPPPAHENIGSDEAAKPGLKMVKEDVCDEEDEEERAMDRLLMRYSTKQSPYEMGKVKEALKPPRLQEQSKDGPTPARATSLPPEPTNPIEMTSNGPERASSFQPDTGHVHPKLPDYDDFLARLAALKGK